MRLGTSRGRGQILSLQGHLLMCSHDPNILVAPIIMTAEMKQAMNHVQNELTPCRHLQLGCHGQGGLGRDDELTGQFVLVGLGEQEADDIGGAIVVEVVRG